MSVSSITASSSWATDQASSTSSTSSFKSRMEEGKKAMDSLEEALKSGDLEKAKSAFATMQKNMPKPPSGSEGGSDSDGDSDKSGPGKDFKTLSDALAAGNIDAAKTAMETIKSHRPKGHHGQQQASGNTDPESMFNPDTTGTVGTQVNVTA